MYTFNNLSETEQAANVATVQDSSLDLTTSEPTKPLTQSELAETLLQHHAEMLDVRPSIPIPQDSSCYQTSIEELRSGSLPFYRFSLSNNEKTVSLLIVLKKDAIKDKNTPDQSLLCFPAVLDHRGELQPPQPAEGFIPTEFKGAYFPTLEQRYKQADRSTWENYFTYIEACYKDWNDVYVRNIAEGLHDCTEDCCLVFEASAGDYNGSLREFYEHLLSEQAWKHVPGLQVLGTAPEKRHTKTLESLRNRLDFAKLNRGHIATDFGLAPSQRIAVHSFISDYGGNNQDLNKLEPYQVSAISGPPGTGKTATLNSLIANVMVRHALTKQPHAPLILATSANNQAVTNINESFNKVAKVESIASKLKQAVESKQISQDAAERYKWRHALIGRFLPRAHPKTSDSLAEQPLHTLGVYYPTEQKIDGFYAEQVRDKPEAAQATAAASSGKGNSGKNFNGKPRKISCFSPFADKYADSIQGSHVHVYYVNKQYRDHAEQYFLKRSRKAQFLSSSLEQALASCHAKLQQLDQERINYFDEFFTHWSKRKLSKFCPWAVQELSAHYFLETQKHQLSQYTQILEELEESLPSATTVRQRQEILASYKAKALELLEDFERVIDTTLRVSEFWLAVHWVEGTWLLQQKKFYDEHKGNKFPPQFLFEHSRAGLFPCAVATLYRLPRLLRESLQNGFAQYHWRRADLLIVDEAGQVMPQLGLAALALAKKTVVVGDALQLAPIHSVDARIEDLMLTRKDLHGYIQPWRQQHWASVNNSLIQLCQSLSQWKYDDYNGGALLKEHYRCYPEIINLCNELLYQGQLQPQRPRAQQDQKNPCPQQLALEVVIVPNSKDQVSGSSRMNEVEAHEIVNWLLAQIPYLYQAYKAQGYNKGVKDFVAVVPPFAAQAEVVKNLLNKRISMLEESQKVSGFDYEQLSNITIDTVHSLQGAECKVVLISTTYGEGSEPSFINNSSELFNVAISRAQDKVVVFGAKGIIQAEDLELDAEDVEYSPFKALNRAYYLQEGAPPLVSPRSEPELRKYASAELVAKTENIIHDEILRIKAEAYAYLKHKGEVQEGDLRALSREAYERVEKKIDAEWNYLYDDRLNTIQIETDEYYNHELEILNRQAEEEIEKIERAARKYFESQAEVLRKDAEVQLQTAKANAATRHQAELEAQRKAFEEARRKVEAELEASHRAEIERHRKAEEEALQLMRASAEVRLEAALETQRKEFEAAGRQVGVEVQAATAASYQGKPQPQPTMSDRGSNFSYSPIEQPKPSTDYPLTDLLVAQSVANIQGHALASTSQAAASNTDSSVPVPHPVSNLQFWSDLLEIECDGLDAVSSQDDAGSGVVQEPNGKNVTLVPDSRVLAANHQSQSQQKPYQQQSQQHPQYAQHPGHSQNPNSSQQVQDSQQLQHTPQSSPNNRQKPTSDYEANFGQFNLGKPEDWGWH